MYILSFFLLMILTLCTSAFSALHRRNIGETPGDMMSAMSDMPLQMQDTPGRIMPNQMTDLAEQMSNEMMAQIGEMPNKLTVPSGEMLVPMADAVEPMTNQMKTGLENMPDNMEGVQEIMPNQMMSGMSESEILHMLPEDRLVAISQDPSSEVQKLASFISKRDVQANTRGIFDVFSKVLDISVNHIIPIIEKIANAAIDMDILNKKTFSAFETSLRTMEDYIPNLTETDKQHIDKIIIEAKDKVTSQTKIE